MTATDHGAASVTVPWSVAEYVGRVIVTVARRTGQTVRQVAGESFALTLWTWRELAEMDRDASVERMGERTDHAGLMAVAFHQPQDLQKAEFRYLQAAGKLSAMFEQNRQRMADTVAQANAAKAALAQTTAD